MPMVLRWGLPGMEGKAKLFRSEGLQAPRSERAARSRHPASHRNEVEESADAT